MFEMIKSVVWLAIILAVAYTVMTFMGYEINNDYFTYSKKKCEEKLKECGDNLIHQGLDNAECNFNCVEPKLIIKKK